MTGRGEFNVSEAVFQVRVQKRWIYVKIEVLTRRSGGVGVMPAGSKTVARPIR